MLAVAHIVALKNRNTVARRVGQISIVFLLRRLSFAPERRRAIQHDKCRRGSCRLEQRSDRENVSLIIIRRTLETCLGENTAGGEHARVKGQRNPPRAGVEEAGLESSGIRERERERELAVVTCHDESESWFPAGAILELTAPKE